MKVGFSYAVGLVGLVAVSIACGSSGSSDEANAPSGPVGQVTIGAGGGSLSTPSGGLKLEVGSEVVMQDTQFTAEDVSEPSTPRKLLDSDGSELGDETPIGGVAYKLGPANVTFSQRLRIEVPVTPTDDPDEFFMLSRQSEGDPAPIPIAIATSRSTVIRASTTHFSTFRKSLVRLRSDACGGIVIDRKSKGCVVRQRDVMPFLIVAKEARGRDLSLSLVAADGGYFQALDPPARTHDVVGLCARLVKTVGCKRLPSLVDKPESSEE